ncbi:hypothetical protein F5X96DRAFT_693972 [Biscogniauxia mediterranea]|nr:hypothetical protein F5X96DRAFT_693972 [Biscogniauxia mediterranea]
MKASPIHGALRLATLILLSLAQDEQTRRALNISVRGRLQQTVLLALPCFALYNGPPRGAVCKQGSVPTYYLEVREATDASAPRSRSRRRTARPPVVKNSGHDCVTRKSGKEALALWVHGLSGLEFHEDFTSCLRGGCAQGVGAGAGRAVRTAGMGASSADVTAFAAAHDTSTVVFKIITPDGVLPVANKCQHADLFWALRGGGGGTFGVVLDATHGVEPAGPVTVALMAGESLAWGRQGWGRHAAGMYLTMQLTFAASAGGTSVIEILPDFIDVWNKYVVSGARQTAGQVRILSSRLIPRSLFENDEGIVKLMNYFAATRDLGFGPRRFYCPVDTPFVTDAVKHGEADKTAVNPAWSKRSIPGNASYAVRLQNLTALTKATYYLRRSYQGRRWDLSQRSKPFTRNWREPRWADNYLAEKCIGFDDADTDNEIVSCQAKLQRDIDESLS